MELEKMIDGMSEKEREQYWVTQSSLSTVSATTPTYQEACEQLGYDPTHPSPFPASWQAQQAQLAERQLSDAGDNEQAGPAEWSTGEVLQLNGWQVTGIAWALRQEELPIRGGIIADDCGTGKTIIMLSVILERARQAILDQQNGGSGPWKPTIVIAPPHVVDVWYEEVQRFFAGELEIWRFYETPDKVTHRGMKARTLPSSTKALLPWLTEHCPDSDPRSCSKIIVTAYDTLTMRTLCSKPSGKSKGKSQTIVWRFMAQTIVYLFPSPPHLID